MANLVLCYHEKRWLDKFPEEFTSEKGSNHKLPFTDIEISRDRSQFITSV